MDPEQQTNMKVTIKAILDEALEVKLTAILDAKLDPILNSLNFISSGFDELMQRVSNLEERNRSLEKENKLLRKDSGDLTKEVNDIKAAVDEQEQYSRRDCLEIRGVPLTQKEDTGEIVKSIGSLLDLEIDDKDLSVSHRLQAAATSTGGPPAIVVKFANRTVRDRLYKSRSKLKNFTISDIGLGRFGEGNIFIQESLTATRRRLFKKSLDIRKALKFKFIWTYYGVIYLRKDETSPAVRITSTKDLEKLRPA